MATSFGRKPIIGSIRRVKGIAKTIRGLKPEEAEIKPPDAILPFDYSEIAKSLKQQQAVTGAAIKPELLESMMAGVVGSQVTPAIERRERALDREARMEMWDQQMAMERAAAEAKGKAGVGAMIGGGIGLATGIPGGAQFGAAAGSVIGAVSIICSELYRQKLISKKVYIGATKYREEYIDDEAYSGYLLWADGVVRAMQKSEHITRLVAFFWIPLTKDMASYFNDTKPSLFGRLITKIVVPFSRFVYKTHRTMEVAHG
jgi:hypothetical protein